MEKLISLVIFASTSVSSLGIFDSSNSINQFSLLSPKLANYGCYCSQLFNQEKISKSNNQNTFLNGQPIDWTDKACFELLQCLKCPVVDGKKISIDGENCDQNLDTTFDSNISFPNFLFYDANDPKYFDKACSKNVNNCDRNKCKCLGEFTVAMLAKPLQ